MKLVRKQIYLEEEMEEELSKLALLRGLSESAIIREALGEYVVKAKEAMEAEENPLRRLIGGLGAGGPDDTSENVDRYLYQNDGD